MAQRGQWWSRTRGLPKPTYASWMASMAGTPNRPTRILAWTNTTDGFCLGSPSALSHSTGGAEGADPWVHVGWHEIERGGWNVETGQLSWALYGGRRGAVGLAEPGRLPELFRERVSASIVLERFVPVGRERGFTVSARRDLAMPDAEIVWHSSLGRGLSWQTEGLQMLVEQAVTRLRNEYDTGGIG
jgi:hypothetical protein